MNKDTLVASALGFGLGLIAAIALWVVPRFLSNAAPEPSEAPVAIIEEEAQPSPVSEGFGITSVENGQIIDSDSVDIAGDAPDSSLVSITSVSESIVTTPDDDGKFTSSLTLDEGANHFVVTSFNESGQEELSLFLFYHPEGV